MHITSVCGEGAFAVAFESACVPSRGARDNQLQVSVCVSTTIY
jgi:hypothetical protein